MPKSEFTEQRLDMHYVVMESAPGTWQYTGDFSADFVYDTSIHCKVVEALEAEGVTTPDDGTCDLCNKAIGYVLYDNDDDPQGNGVRWHWVTAVYYGRHADILLLCEDCSPHAMRDLFEERAKVTIPPKGA